jgi:pyruvate kinase
MKMKRCGKIVATIGPVSQSEKTLLDLINAGMNIARLNFSHGTHETSELVINNIRKIEAQIEKPIGILQDLQGPRIRTGDINQDGILLHQGQPITITTNPKAIDDEIPVDFPDLPKIVRPQSRILLDNGNLEIIVKKIQKEKIEGSVIMGGLLKSNKGINLPGTSLDIPAFTQKDRKDLEFGLSHEVDYVAVSFVQSAQDIVQVRQAINDFDPNKKDTPIIAKLERPEALENLKEIVNSADGVMVARGDLGVEMSPEFVPIAQKNIIEAANRNGKIVITATQMLESMMHHPRPTRAEATDVANAIFDGTDAVMLSGETAIGKYPIKTVETMDAIILKSEENLKEWGRWHGTPHETIGDDASSITKGAKELAHDRNVAAIVVFTESGRTALLMSKAMPRVPIIAFTPDQQTYRRMTLYRGVFPQMIAYAKTIEEMLGHVDKAMIETNQIGPGQQVVVVTGFPVGAKKLPNLALLYTVG